MLRGSDGRFEELPCPRDGPRNRRDDHIQVRPPPEFSLASRTMTWHWRLEDPAGAGIDPASIGVEIAGGGKQGDAESWLGENWRELIARGVATVTLLDGDDEVYGPMSLAAT